jgi:hypothetical protein
MAKQIKSDPITERDLEAFVANDSDFDFEMKVLAQLRSLEFDCEHSGTYRDPVSDKIRQFDIRAHKKTDNYHLALAVECKNLRPNYPLLVSAVPRTATESFHNVLEYRPTPMVPFARVDTSTGDHAAYRRGDMVGKKTDQVGRDSSGNFVGDDSATFDKLNQAVNSSNDLVQDLALRNTPPYIRAILPVLVVPTSLLWQVDYSVDGDVLKPPRQVESATLWLNISWPIHRNHPDRISYCLSHIEFVTLRGLPDAVKTWMGSMGFPGSTGFFRAYW